GGDLLRGLDVHLAVADLVVDGVAHVSNSSCRGGDGGVGSGQKPKARMALRLRPWAALRQSAASLESPNTSSFPASARFSHSCRRAYAFSGLAAYQSGSRGCPQADRASAARTARAAGRTGTWMDRTRIGHSGMAVGSGAGRRRTLARGGAQRGHGPADALGDPRGQGHEVDGHGLQARGLQFHDLVRPRADPAAPCLDPEGDLLAGAGRDQAATLDGVVVDDRPPHAGSPRSTASPVAPVRWRVRAAPVPTARKRIPNGWKRSRDG